MSYLSWLSPLTATTRGKNHVSPPTVIAFTSGAPCKEKTGLLMSSPSVCVFSSLSWQNERFQTERNVEQKPPPFSDLHRCTQPIHRRIVRQPTNKRIVLGSEAVAQHCYGEPLLAGGDNLLFCQQPAETRFSSCVCPEPVLVKINDEGVSHRKWGH